MKTTRIAATLIITGALFLSAANNAHAQRRAYGVASGPNGTVARSPRGAVAVGDDRAAVSTRYGTVATGPNGTVATTRPNYNYATQLPSGYIRVVPSGYRMVYYGGYNCYYVSGVYYRRVSYQGDTVYVIVR